MLCTPSVWRCVTAAQQSNTRRVKRASGSWTLPWPLPPASTHSRDHPCQPSLICQKCCDPAADKGSSAARREGPPDRLIPAGSHSPTSRPCSSSLPLQRLLTLPTAPAWNTLSRNTPTHPSMPHSKASSGKLFPTLPECTDLLLCPQSPQSASQTMSLAQDCLDLAYLA